MVFRIKRMYLLGLGNWLNDQSLSGKDSRARTAFVETIQRELTTVEKKRIELLEANADRDEGGAVKKETVDNSEHYVLSDEAQQKFATEYSTFLSDYWTVEVTDENSESISHIRNVVLNSGYLFGPREGDRPEVASIRVRMMNEYPHWCDAFESV